MGNGKTEITSDINGISRILDQTWQFNYTFVSLIDLRFTIRNWVSFFGSDGRELGDIIQATRGA